MVVVYRAYIASSSLGPAGIVGGGTECTALSPTFNTTTEVPLSKTPNPQLLPGRRSINGCPLLRVCVHGVCVCVHGVCVHFGWDKCRAQIPSMGHHLAVCHITYLLTHFTYTHLHLMPYSFFSIHSRAEMLWAGKNLLGWFTKKKKLQTPDFWTLCISEKVRHFFILLSKDALNCSKVTVKTCIMLQKIYLKC